MWIVKEISPDTKCDSCDEFAELMIRMKLTDTSLCNNCKNKLSELIK